MISPQLHSVTNTNSEYVIFKRDVFILTNLSHSMILKISHWQLPSVHVCIFNMGLEMSGLNPIFMTEVNVDRSKPHSYCADFLPATVFPLRPSELD